MEQQWPQQVKALNLNVINSYYDNLRKITAKTISKCGRK